MYSVVLMMAMTGTAAEAPAGLFHRGGCHGYSGCSGSWDGWGCYGSTGHSWGGAACYGNGNGFAHAQHVACYGYSLNCVGFACFGSYPTYFAGPVSPYHYTPTYPATIHVPVPGAVVPGAVVPGAAPLPAEQVPAPRPGVTPNGTTRPNGKELGARLAPAEVTVSLPADARLFAQGQPTRQTGTERRFQTPALASGKEFFYTLRVELDRGGRTVSETKRVAVQAGERVRVSFSGGQEVAVDRRATAEVR